MQSSLRCRSLILWAEYLPVKPVAEIVVTVVSELYEFPPHCCNGNWDRASALLCLQLGLCTIVK